MSVELMSEVTLKKLYTQLRACWYCSDQTSDHIEQTKTDARFSFFINGENTEKAI